MKSKNHLTRFSRHALVSVVSLFFFAACSNNPLIPDTQLALSRQAVDQAERAGARQFAPVALESAQDKLRRAEQATQREDYALARRLAAEAQADAELAEATTQSEKAQRAATELQASVETLRSEIERRTP